MKIEIKDIIIAVIALLGCYTIIRELVAKINAPSFPSDQDKTAAEFQAG